VPKPDLLARVKSDLDQGYTFLATRRLRTYLANQPHDLEIRAVLADVYRQTGNLVEAGRWSFLTAEVRPEELAAFERANPSPWLRLRLLQFSADPAILPQPAQDRLRVLTVQAERIGPPSVWRGPTEPDDPPPPGNTVPCLFVAIALTVFAVLVGIGLYRVFIFLIHY
jgi:hypothetical protein